MLAMLFVVGITLHCTLALYMYHIRGMVMRVFFSIANSSHLFSAFVSFKIFDGVINLPRSKLCVLVTIPVKITAYILI